MIGKNYGDDEIAEISDLLYGIAEEGFDVYSKGADENEKSDYGCKLQGISAAKPKISQKRAPPKSPAFLSYQRIAPNAVMQAFNHKLACKLGQKEIFLPKTNITIKSIPDASEKNSTGSHRIIYLFFGTTALLPFNEYATLDQILSQCSAEGNDFQTHKQWINPSAPSSSETIELQVPLTEIGNYNACPSGYEVADVCAYINLFNTQVTNHQGYMARLNYHEDLIEIDTANPQFTKDFFGLRSGLIGESGHFGKQTIGAYVAPSDDGNQFIITSSNPIFNHIEISPVFLLKSLAKSKIVATPIRCTTD